MKVIFFAIALILQLLVAKQIKGQSNSNSTDYDFENLLNIKNHLNKSTNELFLFESETILFKDLFEEANQAINSNSVFTNKDLYYDTVFLYLDQNANNEKLFNQLILAEDEEGYFKKYYTYDNFYEKFSKHVPCKDYSNLTTQEVGELSYINDLELDLATLIKLITAPFVSDNYTNTTNSTMNFYEYINLVNAQYDYFINSFRYFEDVPSYNNNKTFSQEDIFSHLINNENNDVFLGIKAAMNPFENFGKLLNYFYQEANNDSPKIEILPGFDNNLVEGVAKVGNHIANTTSKVLLNGFSEGFRLF